MLRSTRAVAGALALALCWFGVAACGDDDPGTDRPSAGTTTAAATPTEPSATASASETAEAMTPVQTVRAWVDAYNEFLRTGSPDAVSALTAHGCVMCESLLGAIAETYDLGGSYREGEWSVAGAAVSDRGRGGIEVSAGIDVAAGEIKRSRRDEFESYPSDKLALKFIVATTSDGREQVMDLVSIA